ncbi:MAG: hypothetical protein WDW38_005929 [Sanguina aurantia]
MEGTVATTAMVKGSKKQQQQLLLKPQPHGHIHVDHHESAHGGKCTHHLAGDHHRSLATRSPHGAEASRQRGERSEYRTPSEQGVIVHSNAAPPQPHSHSHAPLDPKHRHADHADQHHHEHSGQASHTTPDPGTQHPHQHAAPSAPGASSSHRDCGACADHHGRHHTPQALSGAVCCTTAKGSAAACCDTAASDCAATDVVLCLAHTHSSSLCFEPRSSPNICSSNSDKDIIHAHDAVAGYQGRGTCGDGGEQHGHLCPDSQADRWLHSDAQHPTVNGEPHVAAHRAMVVAYLMEVGCVFHSVIIGIDLGLGMDSRTRTITRVTVLCFHQAMEGLGLGAVVGSAGFSRNKAFFMCCLYSLTTPIGVAVGIAISTTYDTNSTAALAVNGAFNGVSAGLLLYVGLVTILVEEFTSKELLLRANNLTRWLMYAALCLSAAGMSVIGIWA